MEAFIFLLVTRRFAIEKGMHEEIDRINAELSENVRILAMLNKQINELASIPASHRIGFFGSIKNVA